MKTSEYLEKYGFDIPFTENELEFIGKNCVFENSKKEVLMEGIVTDLKFGNSTSVKKGKHYLSISFAVGEWWSSEFITNILAPPIYSEYLKTIENNNFLVFKNLN